MGWVLEPPPSTHVSTTIPTRNPNFVARTRGLNSSVIKNIKISRVRAMFSMQTTLSPGDGWLCSGILRWSIPLLCPHLYTKWVILTFLLSSIPLDPTFLLSNMNLLLLGCSKRSSMPYFAFWGCSCRTHPLPLHLDNTITRFHCFRALPPLVSGHTNTISFRKMEWKGC